MESKIEAGINQKWLEKMEVYAKKIKTQIERDAFFEGLQSGLAYAREINSAIKERFKKLYKIK